MGHSSVRFLCPECDESVHEFVDLPGFNYSAEVHSDGNGFATEHVDCGNCSMGFEVQLVTSIATTEATLLGWPGVDVFVEEPEEPDYETEYELYLAARDPNNPFDMYQLSMDSLADVRNAKVPDSPAFQRMVLVNLISIMEAYLSDKLVRITFENEKTLQCVVGSQEALRTSKIALTDLLVNGDFLKQYVKHYLQHMLFHDVKKVEKVYHAALGAQPYPSSKDKAFLSEAVLKRHDCVHRNGRTKDGIEHADIDESYNSRLSRVISRLVQNIERLSTIKARASEKILPTEASV